MYRKLDDGWHYSTLALDSLNKSLTRYIFICLASHYFYHWPYPAMFVCITFSSIQSHTSIIASFLFSSLSFFSSVLTSLSGLPHIPQGRRITCHRWRRLPPSMTNTWPRQGVFPPLRSLLLVCRFLTDLWASLTTTQTIGHNAFQWPVAHDKFMLHHVVHSATWHYSKENINRTELFWIYFLVIEIWHLFH